MSLLPSLEVGSLLVWVAGREYLGISLCLRLQEYSTMLAFHMDSELTSSPSAANALPIGLSLQPLLAVLLHVQDSVL